MIELIARPKEVWSWDKFLRDAPPFSIALDGFVSSSTQRAPKIPKANFDHHAGSDRLATRCTAEQVHMEINMGLFDTFRLDGIPTAKVYLNDPDEDTCLAWWLLKNHEQVIGHGNPRINRLVYCEDRLDCTAGAYPFGDTKMRRQMSWIFEPYNQARFQGQLSNLTAVSLQNIVEAVSGRITEHIFGDSKELSLDGHFERIGGGVGWTFTKETGPASRMAMYNEGVTAFVTEVSCDGDRRVYSMGRKSAWVPFDLPKFYEALNKAEGYLITASNRWGGSDTCGGSPRETGSSLSREKVQQVIEEQQASDSQKLKEVSA